MCADASQTRSATGLYRLLAAISQSVGDWRVCDYGLQPCAKYMVHEQRGAGERSEYDRGNELSVCTMSCFYAVWREDNVEKGDSNRNNNWRRNIVFYVGDEK